LLAQPKTRQCNYHSHDKLITVGTTANRVK
jgi:hypothetical protein